MAFGRVGAQAAKAKRPELGPASKRLAQPPRRSLIDRAAPAALLAATHHPFAAFLALDGRTTTKVRAAALLAAAAAAAHAPRRADPDPPTLRVGKYVPLETLSLLAVGSYAASATALPLRRALGDEAFRGLAAGALVHVGAAIFHAAAGALARLEDRHLVPEHRQLARGGEARVARADDDDVLAPAGGRRQRDGSSAAGGAGCPSVQPRRGRRGG